MTYPRNLRRLSACEMVRIFSFSQDEIQENLQEYTVLNL